MYSPWSWSPTGTHLLTRVGHYEGEHYAVMDVQTGAIIAVPQSVEYPWPVTRMTWMADGRLFVVRNTQTSQELPTSLSGEIWRIDPVGEALVLDEQFPIVAEAEGNPTALGPMQLTNGQLAWGIISQNSADYQTRGLYTYSLGSVGLQKVNGLPVSDEWWALQLSWAPDGSGAFLRSPYARTTLYAPSDGSALYDLTAALGEDACCFAWLD